MGWYFCAISKDALVRYIEDDLATVSDAEIIGKSLRGQRLWVAMRRGEQRFILLYLLKSSAGGDWYKWGYKDMDETMHPYYYDCPLRLLDATKPDGEESEWRKAVRAYHAKRKTVPKPEKHKVVTYGGERYRLNYPIAPRRGWDVTRVRDGMTFRMNAKQVSAALRQEV